MKNPSDNWEGERLGVLGLGDGSVHKTHYPSLRRRLVELEQLSSKLKRSEAYLAEAQRLTHTGNWAFRPDMAKPVVKAGIKGCQYSGVKGSQ